MANWTDHSLLFATQADITTVTTAGKSDHVALLCDTPSVSFDTEITELELLTGAVGGAPERRPGRRSGSLSFNVPLHGLKDELAARGVKVSHHAVWTFLRREGLSFKKNTVRP